MKNEKENKPMTEDEFFCFTWTFRKEKAKGRGCKFPEPLMDYLDGKSTKACAPQGLTLMEVNESQYVFLNDLWCDVTENVKDVETVETP